MANAPESPTEKTRGRGHKLPRSPAGNLKSSPHPHTSPHPTPSHPPPHRRSGRGSRRAPPPSPGPEPGGCKWEVARSRSRGKPAQVTEAGGGDTVREGGPSCGREEGAPRPVRNGDRKVAREIERAPPAGRGEPIPAPRSGRKSYSKGSFFGLLKEELGGPAPGPGIGNGRVLSGPRPGLPGGPARPLAAGSRGRCCPSPSEAPTLPPSRPRARSPRAPSREPAPSSARLPSRAAPPLLPRPLQRPQFTHAASSPALTLPHSHTQRDHGS